jgi:hypothetical protein
MRSFPAWPFRVVCAALALIVPIAAPVWAQERVEPDPPDVTNGSHIVDVGLLQIEMGGVYTRYDLAFRTGGSPITARLGLTDWCEVRIGTDGWLIQSDGATTVSGVS